MPRKLQKSTKLYVHLNAVTRYCPETSPSWNCMIRLQTVGALHAALKLISGDNTLISGKHLKASDKRRFATEICSYAKEKAFLDNPIMAAAFLCSIVSYNLGGRDVSMLNGRETKTLTLNTSASQANSCSGATQWCAS